MVLGATTASYDLEHPVEPCSFATQPSQAEVEAACRSMIGEQQQVPPLFSAVKSDGKSAFQYARNGEEVVLKPKTIEIYDFQTPRIAWPEVDFRIRCSKGTYIRSIARDLGRQLGCGAYLKALRRTAIGAYHLDDSLPLQDFFVSKKDFIPQKQKRFM